MVRSTFPALAAVALMLGSPALPVSAQDMQQQAPAADYGAEELKAFALASLELQSLNDEWIPQISEAESQEEAEQLRAEATTEMTEAIREEGLSVQDYNTIYAQAQSDPELANQIRAYQAEAQ